MPDREPAKWEEQQEHPNWPVVNVTWHQAAAYCEWMGGRLPTEEEWERAARGPSSTKYPWGNEDIDPSRANYDQSEIGHPTPAGLYPSGTSAEGVCDLIGNVLEWTSSEWSKGSGHRVWRGGCFDNNRRNARSSCRNNNQPDEQNENLGFRLAGGCGTGLTACLPESRRGIGGSVLIPLPGRGPDAGGLRQTKTGPGLGLGSRPGPRYLLGSLGRNGNASKICSRSLQVSPCIACPIHACTDRFTVSLSMSPAW